MHTHNLSHKITLTPTCKQERYLKKACGVARFTYNWALDEWQKQYQAGGKPSAFSLKKQFNALKKTEFPWVYEVTKYASQQPFIFLQTAFRNFFNKTAAYPKFKKRGIHDSFYIGNDHIQISKKRIRLPHIGWIKMREALRFSGKRISATVSRIAHRWFVSISVETSTPKTSCENQAYVGVDLGVNHLATLSTGETFTSPKPLRKALKKLKRWQRVLSKKQKGSKNRAKARNKVAKLHYRISCRRQDCLHKLTTHLTQNYSLIAIEDLNVKGMLSNHCLARAISDVGFFELRRQLLYKAQIYGSHIEIVDRWFPSSKLCSQCGLKKETLSLSERIYDCEHCKMKMDRDINAAINLLSTASSAGSEACGEASSGCEMLLQ